MLRRFSKSYLLFIFLILNPLLVAAQTLSGTIKDTKKEAVAFATVYVSALQQGTAANLSGEYKLTLPPGEHEVVFQYLGYQTHTLKVTMGQKDMILDVTLLPQHFNLPEVIVSANGEDPAYFIMRKAISMSGYYIKQIAEYKANVYLKGTGLVMKIPVLLRKQMKNEGIEKGKYYVTETLSEIHYKLGEALKTKVISTRSSEIDQQADPMEFVALSLYQDNNGIISPLSRTAFSVYKFKLEGSFIEDGHTINKIRVIPKRKGTDLYKGLIFIRNGGWNLHSVDLTAEQKIAKIQIRQVYKQIQPMVWMPVSHDFDIFVKAMGIEAKYRYLVSVNDYKITLNPSLDHDFYTRLIRKDEFTPDVEALRVKPPTVIAKDIEKQKKIENLMTQGELTNKQAGELNRLVRKEVSAEKEKPSLEVKTRDTEISDSALMRSTEHWQQYRPVPLTIDELTSFDERPADSLKIEADKSSDSFFKEVLLGTNNRKLDTLLILRHNGLIGLSSFSFNTVEGFVYKKRLGLEWTTPSEMRIKNEIRLNYTFGRERLGSTISTNWLYDPFRRASLSFEGGRQSLDFNNKTGMHPLLNSVSSLFNRQNFMKLYESDFLKLAHQTDIANGLVFGLSAELAKRRQLSNSTDFYLTNITDNTYTSNIPEIVAGMPWLIANHNAFLMGASLTYTPRHYYKLDGKSKEMINSRYPTFMLSWNKGFNALNENRSVFTHWETSMEQQIDLKHKGKFKYAITTGLFSDTSQLYFADYKHVSVNPFWISKIGSIDFRGLDYYERSTKDAYAQAFMYYDHSRIFLKRLPFLANSLIRERVTAGALLQLGKQPYIEIGYGLNQLLFVFSVEIFTSIQGGHHHQSGFRIGIPLGDTTIQF